MLLRWVPATCVLLILAWPMYLSAASFNCARAETATERSICGDPELSRLDAQIAHAYWQRLALTPEEQQDDVRREQRDWLAGRSAGDALQVTLEQRLSALRAGLTDAGLKSLEPESDLAFAFLLSMPQAAPDDGSWELQPPPEFQPDEAALKRYLASRFRRGADIDAYRFEGTLLHHAIRSGLQATALWLLEQGADPTLGIEIDRLRSDALSLAIRHQRWEVMDALRALPSYKPTAERAEAGWMQAPTREALRELWQRQFPWPDGEARRCLLQRALDEQVFDLAAAIPERSPLALAMDDARYHGIWWRWQCRSPEHRTHDFRAQERSVGGFAGSDGPLLAKLDARLQPPLLPFLLPMLNTPTDVERLFALELRQPFDDPEFTASLIKRSLNLALSADGKVALLRRIPREALRRALQAEDLLLRWMVWARAQAEVDFAWALEVIDAPPLDRHAPVLLRGMLGPGVWQAAAADANWARLLAALRGPLAWTELPPMLRASKPANWPALFALGYQPQIDEIQGWLQTATATQLREGWPLLAGQPMLAEHALDWMLAVHRPPLCSAVLTAEDVDKVQALLTLGARRPEPMPFCGRQQREAPAPLSALAQAGLVAPQDPQRRFVYAALDCELTFAGPLRKALSAGRVDGPESFYIDEYYPVELPGARQCGLVVQGNGASTWRREEADYEPTFSSGRMPAPWPSCPDPDYAHRLWQSAEAGLQVQPLPLLDQWPATLELSLRDSSSGRRYYLAVQYRGTCGQDSARLLAFAPDGQLTEAEAEVVQAFEQQCDPQRPDTSCLVDQAAAADQELLSLAQVLALQLHAEFEDFADSVRAQDAERVAGHLRAGLPDDWRGRLPQALGNAGLSVADVDQRLSWLKAREQAQAGTLP